ELFAAISGPLTETLGIRLAGVMETDDGPAKNRIDGSSFPNFDNLAGRVSLHWTPNDKFDVYSKFEISDQDLGGELYMNCLTEGSLAGFAGNSPLNGPSPGGNDRSV